MKEVVSCGGIVIFRGKILLLYKNYTGHYDGWVLPKGTVEDGETYEQTALREVNEEAGVSPKIIKYVGQTSFQFYAGDEQIKKNVNWYLMMGENYYSKPQQEEYFEDSGYYKYHEAYHLLKFANEKEILNRAYNMYQKLKRQHKWNRIC